jgi:predicted transcriptional regulator
MREAGAVGASGQRGDMTELLDKAIAAVRVLDSAEQNRIAEAMLSLAAKDEPEDVDPEHLSDILQGLAEAERGEFVSDEEVAAIFARFRG